MIIERYGWVKDGMIPFVEVDDLIFYGLPMEEYPVMFDQIVVDIDQRYWANRPYVQHKHYDYKPSDTVVEVGAYLGYYTMNVARQVGRVLAVEMVPEFYNIMDMNLKPFDNATAVMKAVSSKKGTAIACKGDQQQSSLRHEITESFSDNTTDISVECDTIDNILDKNKINEVDLMIIQVNGSELEALEGLTLDRVRNLTIATPYTIEGVVKDILDRNGFDVKGDKIMVYGRALPD